MPAAAATRRICGASVIVGLLVGTAATCCAQAVGPAPTPMTPRDERTPADQVSGVAAQPGPERYPDNARHRASSFLRADAVLRRLNLESTSAKQPYRVRSTRLMPYGQSRFASANLQVSPLRMVYEVTTAFSTPVSVGGNVWQSGTRVFLVDAQTGDVLESATGGTGLIPAALHEKPHGVRP